jgi:hypothetical protein
VLNDLLNDLAKSLQYKGRGVDKKKIGIEMDEEKKKRKE